MCERSEHKEVIPNYVSLSRKNIIKGSFLPFFPRKMERRKQILPQKKDLQKLFGLSRKKLMFTDLKERCSRLNKWKIGLKAPSTISNLSDCCFRQIEKPFFYFWIDYVSAFILQLCKINSDRQAIYSENQHINSNFFLIYQKHYSGIFTQLPCPNQRPKVRCQFYQFRKNFINKKIIKQFFNNTLISDIKFNSNYSNNPTSFNPIYKIIASEIFIGAPIVYRDPGEKIRAIKKKTFTFDASNDTIPRWTVKSDRQRLFLLSVGELRQKISRDS